MRAALRWAVSLAVACVFLAPLWWMLAASFRPSADVFGAPLGDWLVHPVFNLHNYAAAVRRAALAVALANTLLQVALVAGAGLLVNSMAAYAFARLEFRGRELLFAVVVALMILPLEALAVPMFLTARDLGLTGGRAATLAALVLPFVAKAFNIYFLRQQLLLLPAELEEAAAIDGAGVWAQFWHIALPSIRPALATVVLLDALYHFSDFLWPLLVATREDTRTVQVSLANLFTQPPVDWGAILAAAVLATLPVMLLFRVLERYLVATDVRVGIR
jgi:multiple sugar transport system permease protein/fructooligosaccharide transport system permease protein